MSAYAQETVRATKSVETLVQGMLDREAIRDLPVRYCHCVWKNDVEGIVNLFTQRARKKP